MRSAVTLDVAELTRGQGRRDADRSLALAALSSSLAEAIDDVDNVLDRVARLVASFLGDTAVIRLLDDAGTTLQVAALHDADPDVLTSMDAALRAAPDDLGTLGSYAAALHGGVLLTGPALRATLATFPAESRKPIVALGVRSTFICPMRAAGRVIGTLGLWRRSGTVHSERDQRFAQELADRAALAIENARLVKTLRDEVQERKRNEENLRLTAELLSRADEKRRSLVDHLVSAQEEERRRIAVDVHDDSIQAMAAIGLRLQMLRRRTEDSVLARQISDIEDAVTESIARLRGLLFRLESSSLERLGLYRALTRFTGELFRDGGPRIRVRNHMNADLHGNEASVLYRIAQEALANVQNHAGASAVTVTLSAEDGGIVLAVQDDGVGFDPGDQLARALPGHLGLRAMRERAELSGGWLQIASSAEGGTTIRCWLPMAAPPANDD